MKSLKVLNRQISWHKGEIHWEADPRHVEILARQLGLEAGKIVKTPGEKDVGSKVVKYRDIDGDHDESVEFVSACASAAVRKAMSGTGEVQGVSASPHMPAAAGSIGKKRWADEDSDEEADVSCAGMSASTESCRRAELSANGWLQGPDGLWRKRFEGAEWLPKCEVGNIKGTVIRDSKSGVIIHEANGVTTTRAAPARAFRKARDVDMIADIDLTSENGAAATPWEDEELEAREASEFRAASARLNYLALGQIFSLRIKSARGGCLRPGTEIGLR